MTHKFTIEDHQKRMREILTPRTNIGQALVNRFRRLPVRRLRGNKI